MENSEIKSEVFVMPGIKIEDEEIDIEEEKFWPEEKFSNDGNYHCSFSEEINMEDESKLCATSGCSGRQHQLSLGESLRMVLIPDGDQSEDDFEEDEAEADVIAPTSRIDQIIRDDENVEALSELENMSQVEVERNSANEDDEDHPLASFIPSCANRNQKHSDPRWRRNKFNPPEDILWKDTIQIEDVWRTFTPLQFFKIIFDDDLFQHITEQTNVYALQTKGLELGLKTDELQAFIGILMKFGMVKVPSLYYVWKKSSRYPPIADAIGRDKFEKIKSFLHFNDNTTILPRENPIYDKLFRIRPVMESIRSNLHQIPQEEHQAVDEQIIPTKAHNSLKQYIPKKPHKWGYKMFLRAGESGFIYDFLLYTGQNCIKDNENVGLSSAYILKLIDNVPRNKNYKIYFDNWFSSVPLIDVLNSRGILCLSTVRPNRLKGLKLKEEKELKREGRGSLDYSIEQNTNSIAIKWYDNKPVHLLSNYAGVEPIDTCDRWDKKNKRRIDVKRPFAVKEYNKFMGGVDLCDMLIELYRIDFRSKKWYMRIFHYLLDMSVVNAWLLYRRVMPLEQGAKTLSLLDFKEDVSSGLISKVTAAQKGLPSSFDGPVAKKRRISCRPSDSSRFDQTCHLPTMSTTKQRCRQCVKARPQIQCKKCNVNLCITVKKDCFYLYHTK